MISFAVVIYLIQVIWACTPTVATISSTVSVPTQLVPNTGAGSTKVLTVGSYLTSYDATCAGTTFSIKDNLGNSITTWATTDASGNLFVDNGVVDSKQIKIVVSYNGQANVETNLFSLTVQCPALTQNAVTSVEKYIPSPSAPAKVKVVTGIGGYAQTTSTHSSCAIQGFVLKAGGATYSGSWLVITSQGNVEVDTNIIGVQSSLTVAFTYGGTSYTTSSFKIEVKCPSLTASSISNFNKDLSNTALIEVIVNAGFVSGGSTDMATCTVSYQVVKAADNSPLGGTWLTLGAGGKIQLNRQILGSETVKIKYTQNGVDAFTNAFSVTVACPSISSVTPNALYSYDIPNTAATSDTTVLPSSGYINNPSTMSACALTLTLVEASDGTTPIVGWLTIDGAGTIKVNTNALGDKTAKVKIKRPSTTPPIDQISGQFQVIVKCPQISQNTVSTPISRTVPTSPSGTNVQVIAGSSYASTTSSHSACALSFQLWQGSSQVGGSWITIGSSDGNIAVDTDVLGDQKGYFVKIIQAGVAVQSSLFDVKVVCPAQTDKNPSGVSSLSQTIPNTPAGSPTQILTKSDYVSTTTTASACTFSTFVLLDAASGNPLTSSWLTVDASGNVKVDQNKKGKLTVKMRYTYGGQVVTNPNQFDVLVHCPDLTKPSFTPATPYNYPFTVGATSKTQFITGSSYVSTTSTSSQCPLTFTLFDVTSSSAYSGSFLEVDAQGNVKVDTNQKLSKTIKAQWQYYDKTPDPTKLTTGTTPQFVISTSCPTLVLTAISPATYSFDLPTSPASSATVLKTGASYVNIAVAKCAKTYQLIEKPSNAAVTTWLTTNSNGDILLDTNQAGTKTVAVKVTYDGSTYESSQFTVTVKCPALTTTAVSPPTYTLNVPATAAGAPTKIITASKYITNPSTNAKCKLTHALYLKGTTTPVTSWLTIDAAGDIFVDTNVRGEKEVFVRSVWAFDGSNQDSSVFKVSVSCPALTLGALNAQYTNLFTPNGGITLKQLFLGTAYVNANTALTSQCPITYKLYAHHRNEYVGTWLHISSTGTVSINTDVVGNRNIRIRYTYYSSPTATTSTYTYGWVNVRVDCPPWTYGPFSTTNYTFVVQDIVEPTQYEFISNSYVPSGATCPIRFYVAYADTGRHYCCWIRITSTGAITVDRNWYGNKHMKVRVYYGNQWIYSTQTFTVIGKCPALSHGLIVNIPAIKDYNFVVPNSGGGWIRLINNYEFAKSDSTQSSCKVRHWIENRKTRYMGWNHWTGYTHIHNHYPMNETVRMRIQWEGVNYYTAYFKVIVLCPTPLLLNHTFLQSPAIEKVPMTPAASFKKVIENNYYVKNPNGATSTPLADTWAKLEIISSRTTGNILLDINTPGKKDVKVQYVYNNVTTIIPTSGTIRLQVDCPAISVTQPQATYTYTVPDTTSPAQTVINRVSYIANYPPICPIKYELQDAAGTTLSAPSHTWLTLSATGDLTVDVNMWGSKQIKIKYTDQYPNVVAYTDVFTVTVACPALITNAISTTSFTYVVPTFVEANPILIIPNKSPSLTATPYAKTNSLATNCKISYALFDSSDAPYTGSLLKVNADGDVSLDINAQISGTFKVKYTYGGATADSTSFTVSVTCAPQSLSSWVPKPATQPSNCNPWTSAAFVNGPPPAGASESCDVKLQSIDTDYSRIIVSGGQTSDANRVLGKTDLKCFADFRGFVNKYTNGAKDWEKYIHGNPGSTDKNVVTGVMWIGLSKDARSNNQGVYTDMMGAYIRTTYTDLVVFINLADGSFTNVQHILLSDVGTFSGYDLAVYSPSWQDIFKFQLLSHGGSISDYRVFYAFIDKSTIDGKKWTLHSRSTTELQSSIDSSTGKFIYGAQCIQHYGNLLYWGGGREHSQPPISGVSPVIGTSSPDTLVVQSAMTFNGPMTSASDPRYIVEKIYFSRDSSNHLLAAFARKRHDTAMASVDDSVKHMLIVGRDHLSSSPWKGNVGCFDFSVYLFQLDSQKLLYIDDVVGPISSKLYVFMRTWNGNGAYNNPNYILQKSTDFDKAYVVSVEKWDGVNCVSGTTDTKTTGIFMDYQKYDTVQCKSSTGQDHNGRLVSTSRTSANFIAICNTAEVQPGTSTSFVSVNGGKQAGSILILKGPSATINKPTADHTLLATYSWQDIKSEFSSTPTKASPTIVSTSTILSNVPSSTVIAANGYPAMVVDLKYTYTASQGTIIHDYDAFGTWDQIAQTQYHIQQYAHPTAQVVYSVNDVTTTGLNYTAPLDNIISLNHQASNTKIRLGIEKQSSNCPQKEFYFYIGAINFWSSALSPLFHVKFECPTLVAPNQTPSGLKSSGLYKGVVPVQNGWHDVYWNPWINSATIQCCGFQRYEVSRNTSTATYLNYNHYNPTICDKDEQKCNYVSVNTGIQQKLYFDVSARRVAPFSDISGTIQYFLYITTCLDINIQYKMSIPTLIYDNNLVSSYSNSIVFYSVFGSKIEEVPPNKNCPPQYYELRDIKDDSKQFYHQKALAFDLNNPMKAKIMLMTDIPIVIQFYLRVYSYVDTFAEQAVKIIVCGNETIRTLNNDKIVMMYQQDANSFTTINETTMLNYFFTFHYFTKACYIKDFKLYKLFDSNKYYSEDWDALKYPELQLQGQKGSWEWKISRQKTYRHQIWLGAITRGKKYAFKEFEINVCSAQTFQQTKSYVPKIKVKLPKYATNTDERGKYVVSANSYLRQLFTIDNCPYCQDKQQFELLEPGLSNKYTGQEVTISDEVGMTVNTTIPKRGFIVVCRIGMKKDSKCNFIKPMDISFEIEICGYERIKVKDPLKSIKLTKIVNIQRNSKINNVTDLFTLEAGGSTGCPIIKYEIWDSKREGPDEKEPKDWSRWILIKNNDLYINHNNIDQNTLKNNTEYKLYITAITFGNIIGQKILEVIVQIPPTNSAPKFTKDVQRWIIKIDGDDQWRGFNYPIISKDLPQIKDKENDKISIKLKQPLTPCDCIKIHSVQQTNKNKDIVPKVWVTVDRSKITYRDEGIHIATIEFIDDNQYQSYERGYELFEIQIKYNQSSFKVYDYEAFIRNMRLKQKTTLIVTKEQMRKNWFNWYTNEVFKKTASFISQYPGTVLINPIIPKTRKSMLISKNLFKQNLKKYKEHLQQKYNFPKSKKYKKVKLEITDISQNGQLRIDFNQKLLIPPFNLLMGQTQRRLQNNPNQSGRNLQDLYKFDVDRDIFEFKYRLRNQIESDSIKYDVIIQEWTEWHLNLQLNFEYPRNVSKYDQFDHIIIKIKNPDLFVSASSGQSIDMDYKILKKAIPKQYGTLIDTHQLANHAKLFISLFRLIIGIMIAYCIWFGYSMRDLWILLYVLQIICYTVKSDVHFPITAGIFIDQLTSFIEFDLINPFFYVQLADKQFRVDKWILGKPWSQVLMHKSQESSYLNDYSVYMFWSVFIFICFWVFKIVKFKTRNRLIRKIINNFYWLIDKKLYFNGFIRIYSVIYLHLCFSCFEQMEMWVNGSVYQNRMARITTLVIFIFIFVSLFYILLILMNNRFELGSYRNRAAFSNLYDGVHLYRDHQNVFYFPIFLTRRLLFAATPFLFPHLVGIQLFAFMYLTLSFFSWYAYFRPHEDERLKRLELFNEFMILITSYVCILFTELNVQENSFNNVGTFYVAIICFIIVVNLVVIIHRAWTQWNKYKDLQQKQLQWRQFIEDRTKIIFYNMNCEQYNKALLKNNPHAAKPKIKRQTKVPKYYRQKISYLFNEEKFENLKKITNKNTFTSIEEVQQIINHTIFIELGNFGDIVELSREDILKDYCQPINKKHTDGLNLELQELKNVPYMPKRLTPFIITYDQSSRNRWQFFHDTNRTLLEKYYNQFARAIVDCCMKLKLKIDICMGREPPIDPHMTEKETEIIGKHLTHLDTQKAIDHFQTVRMKEDKKRKKAEVMHKVSNKDQQNLEDLLDHEEESDDGIKSNNSNMHFDDYMAIDIHGLQHKTLSPGKVFDTPKLQEDETNGKKEDESSEEGDQENQDTIDIYEDISQINSELSSFRNTVSSMSGISFKTAPTMKKLSFNQKIEKLELKPIEEGDEWMEESKVASDRKIEDDPEIEESRITDDQENENFDKSPPLDDPQNEVIKDITVSEQFTNNTPESQRKTMKVFKLFKNKTTIKSQKN